MAKGKILLGNVAVPGGKVFFKGDEVTGEDLKKLEKAGAGFETDKVKKESDTEEK